MPEHLHAEAYPLSWPQSKPRTQQPRRAPFFVKDGWQRKPRPQTESFDFMMSELDRLAKDLGEPLGNTVVSTNKPVRRDGVPYANVKEPEDSGVALYFTLAEEQYVFACDQWDRVTDNMYAIGRTIEAIRQIRRDGSGEMFRSAFTGFKALPEQGSGRAWWIVLGVRPNATADEIRVAYRRRAKETHPDTGGSTEAFNEVMDAYNQALQGAG